MPGKLKQGRIASRKLLYRRLGSFVIVVLVFFALSAPRSLGQGGKPQLKRPANDIPESKPPEKKAKKIKEPRAVGILQMNSGGKGTLVPVAILIDGKFYDASAYKADPIPMALESGTVYEAEQAGDPQGLFTINGALHSKSPGSAHPWVGTGTYLPKGVEAPTSTRKAEDVPVGIDNNGDEPPRLTRKIFSKPAASDAGTVTPAGAGTGENTGGTTPAASGKPVDESAKQPARPATQTVPDKTSSPGSPNQTSSGQSAAGQSSSGQPSSGQSTSGQTASGPSSEDYYRPTLRRGKPTQAAPKDEDSTAVKKGNQVDAPVAANSADLGLGHMVAAISDAAGPEPQSYKFFWKTGEEEEKRNEMLALAESDVRAYVTALVKNQIPARPAASKMAVAGRKVPAKQAQPVLENVQFGGFDVWLTNQLVMILSAEAHFPTPPGPPPVAESYNIMLVARTDIYGNLRKLYSGVTDKFHLDVTPRLEFVDVVDADGDRRGELLFRETSDAGSGYVIYRATADKLWKMFDSLNAE